MGPLCIRFGAVRRTDRGARQVRHPENGFDGRHRHPDDRGAGVFVADGLSRRLAEPDHAARRQDAAVSDPLGPGYRRELALLLPRAADRRYQ